MKAQSKILTGMWWRLRYNLTMRQFDDSAMEKFDDEAPGRWENGDNSTMRQFGNWEMGKSNDEATRRLGDGKIGKWGNKVRGQL